MGLPLEQLAASPAPAPAPSPAEPEPRARRRHLVGPALLVLATVLFLGHGWRTISAPFGDSHDGRNAGVWAAGSRALREAGPVESRLGTRSPENGVYANHPPLLYVETAVAELAGGGWPGATRAPAWAGSLLAIGLAAVLLRERGLCAGAAAMAVLLTLLTPMFLVYGTMLDTPVTSLPVGIGLLVLWERNRRGLPVRPVVAAAVAAVAVLSGWLALSLAMVLAGWAAVRFVGHPGRRPVDLAFAGGALAGAGLLVAWLLWAFGGSLAPLLDQFSSRTGQAAASPVGWGAWGAAQARDLPAMFGPIGLLAALGLVAALRDVRTRAVAAVALAVTLSYQLLFRSAAASHEYWGYWLLLPCVIGLAAGCDRLLRWWAGRGRGELAPALAVAVVAALFVGAAWARPAPAESRKRNGLEVASVVESARAGYPDQATAWYAGAVGEPAAWLGYALRRPASVVPGSQWGTLAGAAPGDLVLVGEVRCPAGEEVRAQEVRTARSLGERPPVIRSCSAPQPDGLTGR